MKPRPTPSVQQLRVLNMLDQYPGNEVIGVDEVGLGAWAGPLVVGGVVLDKKWDHSLCRDSKILTESRRHKALRILQDNWLGAVTVGMEAIDLDLIGPHDALAYLTRRVIQLLSAVYPTAIVVQDGDVPVPVEGRDYKNMLWLPSGDDLVPAVSAASIFAKVTRDDDMVGYDQGFPEYDFRSNKGYHARRHVEALDRFGPTPVHRYCYRPVRERVVKSEEWQYRLRPREISVWTSFKAP